VVEHNAFAVEEELAYGTVPISLVHTKTVRPAEQYFAGFAELDLLPIVLNRIETHIGRHAESLGLGQKLSHPLYNSQCFLFSIFVLPGIGALLGPGKSGRYQND